MAEEQEHRTEVPVGADDPDGVVEALDLLTREGYTQDFDVRGGKIVCGACGEAHGPEGLVVERLFRYEGPTDPGDEMIVLGIYCPSCDARGRVISAYGPDIEPEVADLLRAIAR